jgi:hypothetical protein
VIRALLLAAAFILALPSAAAACIRLPPPAGRVIDVSPGEAARLPSIVRDAPAGATVRLAAGRYAVDETLRFARPGVTLRSGGDAVLDAGYGPSALLAVAASRVTITDVTLTRARDHFVHAVPPEGGRSIAGLRLHRLRLVDSGEQFVKANLNASRTGAVHRGRVSCSDFSMTAAGRQRIERAFGCYTGGIDVHGATAWRVRRNRFSGIYCEDGEVAEHAVHFWRRSRGTLIERNLIRDCSRGIGLGLTDDPGDGHFKGIVRRNAIVAGVPQYDTGIEIAGTAGAVVVHNTVAERDPGFSSIDVRFARAPTLVANNLVRRMTLRDGARVRARGNVERFPLSWLRDDVHLRAGAGAVDRGVRLRVGGRDVDGDRVRGRPDVGADER